MGVISPRSSANRESLGEESLLKKSLKALPKNKALPRTELGIFFAAFAAFSCSFSVACAAFSNCFSVAFVK